MLVVQGSLPSAVAVLTAPLTRIERFLLPLIIAFCILQCFVVVVWWWSRPAEVQSGSALTPSSPVQKHRQSKPVQTANKSAFSKIRLEAAAGVGKVKTHTAFLPEARLAGDDHVDMQERRKRRRRREQGAAKEAVVRTSHVTNFELHTAKPIASANVPEGMRSDSSKCSISASTPPPREHLLHQSVAPACDTHTGGRAADTASAVMPSYPSTLEDCVVCMDNTRSHVLVPCGHCCVCESCAELIRMQGGACPTCRGETTQAIRLFIP